LSSSRSGGAGEFVTLARVVKTQGRRGEVAAELHTHVPDRFRPGVRLWILADDDSRREAQVENIWRHGELLVVKFAGVDSISEAHRLIGSELQVPRELRAPLGQGWNYISDLVGCTVHDRDRLIGQVQEVRLGAGEAPLLIVRSGSTEYDIAYADAYLSSVDIARKQIRMQLPEGMLDINAPLTPEEKKQQNLGKRR
jgi:16S rRNA processing protein RimM